MQLTDRITDPIVGGIPKSFIKMTDTKYIEGLFIEANEMMYSGQYKEAKESLEQLLEIEPDYGRAHNHLAWIYETKIYDVKRAAYHYRLALKFTPDYTPVYRNYSLFLFEQQEFEAHAKVVQAGLKTPGCNTAMLLNELGRSAEARGDFKTAVRHYKKAARASLDDLDIDLFRANRKRARRKLPLFSRFGR